MVKLIDLPALSRLLSSVCVEPFIRELAAELARDFERWTHFEKSPRLAAHSPFGVIELMPTHDGRQYAFKFVNGHPGNTSRGKLTVTAFGVLADVETGYPLLLAEMTVLTALRTAATSALAARYLARPDSSCMALIGTGAQGEFQALAFKACLGIRKLRYFDTDAAAMRKLAHNLAGYELDLVPCQDITSCIEGADVITTATAHKSRQRLFDAERIAPGTHLNAIGGDCPGKTEIDPRLVRSARVFVEYEPQTRIEGDIQGLDSEVEVTELWRVVTGAVPGRTLPTEITLFDSVGFAVEDFTTLRYVHAKLESLGLGESIDLIPQLGDPKDLFGLLRLSANC